MRGVERGSAHPAKTGLGGVERGSARSDGHATQHPAKTGLGGGGDFGGRIGGGGGGGGGGRREGRGEGAGGGGVGVGIMPGGMSDIACLDEEEGVLVEAESVAYSRQNPVEPR